MNLTPSYEIALQPHLGLWWWRIEQHGRTIADAAVGYRKIENAARAAEVFLMIDLTLKPAQSALPATSP